MHRLIPSVLLAAIIALIGLSSQAVLAQTERQHIVFLVDRQAVSQTDDGADATKSVLSLVSTLRDQQYFTFDNVDGSSNAIGPLSLSDAEFVAFQNGLDGWLGAGEPAEHADLLGALAETAAFLGNTGSAPGSAVYLITSGPTQSDLNQSTVRLEGLANRFQSNGWKFVGLGLPGTSSQSVELLNNVSSELGGQFFDLSTPGGFKSLSDSILEMESKGALSDLGGERLSNGGALASKFGVAPGTQETNLLVFKESQGGKLTLSDPAGVEMSSGDAMSSFIVESPSVVIWRLLDPAPGEWQLNVQGIEGAASTWQYVVHGYTPVLESLGTTPLNEPAVLIASVKHEQQTVTADDIRLTARVSPPKGTTLSFGLNDDGVSGDAIAGDGFYSTTLPPLSAEGQHAVELQLSWIGLDHRVTSQAEFRTQAFPSLDVTTLQTKDLKPGERTKIADVLVNIQGQPFAVPTDQLTGVLASSSDVAGVVEIEPKRLLDQERAWSYEVFFTPEGESLHTMDLRLNLEYSGRQYAYMSDSIVLSSLLPYSPPAQQPAALQAPAPPAPIQVGQQKSPAPGYYWGLLSIPGVILIILIGWAIYWLTRRRPHGFIYSDRGELIVDFANIRRSRVMKFFSKDSVWGKEISIPGLEGVSFNFAGRHVGLQNRERTHNVRVDNQPLVGNLPIRDRTWIGTEGRLYNFQLSRLPPPRAQGAAGDGD